MAIKRIFSKSSSPGLRILVCSFLAVLLFFLDYQFGLLKPLRSFFSFTSTPVYWLGDLPGRLWDWGDTVVDSRQDLQQANAALKAENLILQQKIQKMASLMAENTSLRELLNSSELLNDKVLIAELIGVSPNPLRHEVVLNRGSSDGVFVGQPVLDAYGLFGHVIEVNPFSSRVMMIVDSKNAVPVLLHRNGLRLIAEGQGRIDNLGLRNVVETTDIKVGDLLVSSGLGKRYPEGYPVAEVSAVVHRPGDAFLDISAKPLAHLRVSRQLLLVFNADKNTYQEFNDTE